MSGCCDGFVGGGATGSSGGGSGVDVQNNGVAIPNNPHSTLNLKSSSTGDPMTVASDSAGVANLLVIDAVVFDDSVPAAHSNVRTDRATEQSPIDNTRVGITNLSSFVGSVDAAAAGATNNHATIGGGKDNSATGEASTVPGGGGNAATGDYAIAEGLLGKASREGQRGFASGAFSGVPGQANAGEVVLRGTTILAANQTTVLMFGAAADQEIILENGKAYAFDVRCIVYGVQGGVGFSRTLKIAFTAFKTGGVTTIDGTGAGESFGNANGSTFSLTPTVGVAPDRVVLTFATGTENVMKTRIAAWARWTEVISP